jgi:hypothetical protein
MPFRNISGDGGDIPERDRRGDAMRRLDPGLAEQSGIRTFLRIGGPIVFGVGLLLTAIAVIDFLSAFGSFGPPPTRFGLAFLGLPLMAVGWAMIQAGFFGAAARYVAGEVTPTLRDAMGALGLSERVACASCGGDNERGARFCSSCGRPMAQACPACGADNDAEARFCNRCGGELAPA